VEVASEEEFGAATDEGVLGVEVGEGSDAAVGGIGEGEEVCGEGVG
jgi:hypothetical protein